MELRDMLDTIIGAKLIELSDEGFTVRDKDGKECHFIFEQDEGGLLWFQRYYINYLFQSE